MPSSHGGSSSGGGGFHSSGGYHGGGGGGRNSGPRFSTKGSFPGARRYYYTNRFGRTCFFYYAARPTRQSAVGNIIMPLIFLLAGFAVAAFIIYALIPTKISASACEYTGVQIVDNANILGDTTSLKGYLQDFYESTGIEPCFYTVKIGDVPDRYGSLTGYGAVDHLGNYAYDLYVKTYNDEGHWLIVYAIDEDGYYVWTDMAGDDTMKITDETILTFADVFDKNIIREVDVCTAATRAFKEVNGTAMKLSSSDKKALAFVIVVLIIWSIGSGSTLISGLKRTKTINAYCDYRDKRGGVDFYEGGAVGGNDNVSYTEFTDGNTKDGSDLFD